MGINVLNNTSSQEIRMPTGPIPVASGDLILNSDAGVAYVASTALTSAQNNYASAVSSLPSALGSWNQVTGGAGYTGDQSTFNMASMAQLSNGSIAFAFSGNGTSNRNQTVNLSYRLLDGTYATGNITVSSGNVYQTVVRRMTTVGAAVVWNDGSNINFAIYSNTGTAVKTTTAVGTNNSASQKFNAAVLTNGYLVIAFQETSTADCKLRIYDTTGTLVGSTVTVEAGSTPENICVVAQSNGNFVVYYRNSSSSITKFARYNSSGTLQGALTTVRNSASLFSCGNLDYLCIELANGNLVMQASNSGLPVWYMYDSSGTSVVGATNWYNDTAYQNSTYLCTNAIGTLVASSSGFLAAGRGQAIYFATYDLNGSQTKLRATFSQPTNPPNYQINNTTGYACNIVSLGNWGYACLFGGYDNCALNAYLYFCVRSVAGNTTFTGGTIGADVNLGPGASYPDYSANLILTADGSCAMSANFTLGNGYTYWGSYAVQKRSITGVAQEAISTFSTGRVATYGTQPLRLTYTSGGAFNNTAATVPGAKGSYIGGTAVLNGIVA